MRGEFAIEGDELPLPERHLVLGANRGDRAFRLAERAVDAFIGVDDEEVGAFVEAVHGTTSTQSVCLRRMHSSSTTKVMIVLPGSGVRSGGRRQPFQARRHVLVPGRAGEKSRWVQSVTSLGATPRRTTSPSALR